MTSGEVGGFPTVMVPEGNYLQGERQRVKLLLGKTWVISHIAIF